MPSSDCLGWVMVVACIDKRILDIVIKGGDQSPGLTWKERDALLHHRIESSVLASSIVVTDELHDGLVTKKPGLCV